MLRLLKADFKKLKYEKMILIMLFVVIGCSFLFTGINILLESLIDTTPTGGKYIFLASFSITNNMGLVVPIIMVILLGKEYTNGTIRNKIICGYRKTHIYLSSLIVLIVVGFMYMLLHALLNMFITIIFNGYGVAFNLSEFFFLLSIIGLNFLIYAIVFSASAFVTMLIKSTGLSILAYFGFLFISLIIFSLFTLNGLPSVFKTIYDLTFFAQSMELMTATTLSSSLVLRTVFCSIGVVAIINTAGILLYKKLDLK